MKRMGAKKRPYYRVVVTDSRAARDSRYIEAIGTYNPILDPKEIKIDKERALAWMAKGARPTPSVKTLFSKAGVLSGE